MRKLDLSEHKFTVNGKEIDHANIKDITFKKFIDITEQIVSSNEKDYTKSLLRLQVKNQVELIAKDGTPIPLDIKDIITLPVKLGVLLTKNVTDNAKQVGEITQDGDGIEKPVIYKLGTPIKSQDDDITEIEFQVKTYGDIEDVLSEGNVFKRAYTLITSSSVPIMKDMKYQRTPLAMADQISVTDGLAIGALIVPRFLSVDVN